MLAIELKGERRRRNRNGIAKGFAVYLRVLGGALMQLGGVRLRADEPYARSRDYDLQHSRVALRFDLERKRVIGDVTHTVSLFREGLQEVSFDSVGLQIQSVKVNKTAAKFETTDTKLVVKLPKAGKIGEKFEIEINYEGQPAKGSPGPHGETGGESAEAAAKGGDDQRLMHLEQLVEEMNERLKATAGRLPAAKQ